MSSTEADVLSTKGHETFEPAFETDQVPRIQVPDLPEDAQGLTAQELAKIPPSGNPAEETALATPEQVPSAENTSPTIAKDANISVLDELEALPVLDEVHAQEIPVHVDTWIEVLQKRTEKLTEDIRVLHERLDLLEKNQRVNHGGS